MNLDDYLTLKEESETLERDLSRAEGALGQLLERLRRDFKMKSLREAEAKLADLERKRDQAASRFDKEMKSFNKKWKGKFDA